MIPKNIIKFNFSWLYIITIS